MVGHAPDEFHPYCRLPVLDLHNPLNIHVFFPAPGGAAAIRQEDGGDKGAAGEYSCKAIRSWGRALDGAG